ncbi:MAG: AI-2E family transporter [Pseudomonadota bacterium]
MPTPDSQKVETCAQAITLLTRAEGREPRPLQTLVLLLLTALGLWLCWRMAAPFLPAIALAVALAVMFVPLQRLLEKRLRNSSIAALISVLAIAVVVVVPALFVAQQLVTQAARGAQLVDAKVTSGEWQRAVRAQPQLPPLIERIDAEIDLPGAVRSVTAKLSGFAGAMLKGSVFNLIAFVLTFYLLFFFLRDRQRALTALRGLLPLTEHELDRLFARINDTLHATIYGTLAVAALQGLLGGLMFWWLDLPAPLLWGVIMALLAVVPVLGAFVVWIPAALFLLLEGSWEKALILVVWGAAVVGTIDNLLRPMWVGARLKQHTILAFLSVVGGLIVFGAAGLILGPVTLTITLVLLEVWAQRTASPP